MHRVIWGFSVDHLRIMRQFQLSPELSPCPESQDVIFHVRQLGGGSKVPSNFQHLGSYQGPVVPVAGEEWGGF